MRRDDRRGKTQGRNDRADLAEVLKSALDLKVEDRAALAERLLSSLEELSPDEADRVWAIEAERRLEPIHDGRASTVAAEEVHKKAARLLR